MRSGQRNRTQKGLRLQCPSARATGQPVSGDRREYGLNVLRQNHRSSAKHRPGTGGGEKQETGTRREPAARARIRAAADIATCGREQRLHVVEQRRRNVNGNGFFSLNVPLAYPGLAAIAAVLYGGAFFFIYLVFRYRLQWRLGIKVGFERRVIQLFVMMFVLAVVGGVTVIGLAGFIEYTLTIAFEGVLGALIGLALIGAVALCSLAFAEAEAQSVMLRNTTLLSTFAWIGLAFIAAYHILWLVFVLTLISIWPLRAYTIATGVK